MDVGQHATLGDSNVPQKFVQFLIVAYGELKMTGNNTRLLVITSGIASQLENFGGKILQHSSKVNRSASTDTLSVVSFAQKTMNTANGERQAGLRRARLGALAAASFPSRFSSSHFEALY